MAAKGQALRDELKAKAEGQAAAVKARFCACEREAFVPAVYVFVKSKGVLTTQQDEADKKFPNPVGVIDNRGRVKLNATAQAALEAAGA